MHFSSTTWHVYCQPCLPHGTLQHTSLILLSFCISMTLSQDRRRKKSADRTQIRQAEVCKRNCHTYRVLTHPMAWMCKNNGLKKRGNGLFGKERAVQTACLDGFQAYKRRLLAMRKMAFCTVKDGKRRWEMPFLIGTRATIRLKADLFRERRRTFSAWRFATKSRLKVSKWRNGCPHEIHRRRLNRAWTYCNGQTVQLYLACRFPWK